MCLRPACVMRLLLGICRMMAPLSYIRSAALCAQEVCTLAAVAEQVSAPSPPAASGNVVLDVKDLEVSHPWPADGPFADHNCRSKLLGRRPSTGGAGQRQTPRKLPAQIMPVPHGGHGPS